MPEANEQADQPVEGPPRPRRGWIGRLLPWTVAVAVLAYLLSTIPATELGEALARTTVWLLIPLSIVYIIALLFADSLAMWVGFRAALPGTQLAMTPVLLIRGASYLLATVSYGAGQGGIVYFLKRRHHVPLGEAAGAVLLTAGAFVIVLATAMGIGLLTGEVPDRPELRLVAVLVVAAAPAYLAVVALRPGFLARWSLLRPFFDAGVWGTLRIVAARGLHTSVLLTGHYLAMHLFGIDVPLDVALTRLPVLFVVAALPISPSGLGTTQAAAITLFAGYASGASEGAREAAVFAYSLSFHFVSVAVTAAVGLVCLRKLTASGPDGAFAGSTEEDRAGSFDSPSRGP